MTLIKLPVYGLKFEVDPGGGGRVVQGFKLMETPHVDPREWAAFDALESIILAHACAGIDITTPAYLEGIDVAVDAVCNNLF